MYRLLVLPLAMALTLTIIACGGEQAPPTFEPHPTPTASAEFSTFTDELSLFTISYPTEWELALSLMAGLEEAIDNILESKKSNLPLEATGIVFFAGKPAPEGYDPTINVGVESLPTELGVQQYFEGSERGVKEVFTGYQPHSQTSSPSEDYLAVLAGQRQWIATTNCAGCPGRPQIALRIAPCSLPRQSS